MNWMLCNLPVDKNIYKVYDRLSTVDKLQCKRCSQLVMAFIFHTLQMSRIDIVGVASSEISRFMYEYRQASMLTVLANGYTYHRGSRPCRWINSVYNAVLCVSHSCLCIFVDSHRWRSGISMYINRDNTIILISTSVFLRPVTFLTTSGSSRVFPTVGNFM